MHVLHKRYVLHPRSFCLSRFDLHQIQATITFVNNLAICDFSYCVIHLPIYAMSYFNQSPPFKSDELCRITAIFRNTVCYATYMFISMIGLARFLKVMLQSQVLTKYRVFLAIGVWLYATLMCSLQFLEVP